MNRTVRFLSPLLDVAAGLLVSGLILAIIGVDPVAALRSLIWGAFGYPEAIGYTLYYMTTYCFTGLAVWVALRAGLFNIGGEGQIYLGGLGAGLTCIALHGVSGFIVVPLACAVAIVFGAAWAFIPAFLLVRRGSSLVVNGIMFNFIASALMTWLLTAVMIKPGQAAPETDMFPTGDWMPSFTALARGVGIALPNSPANLSLLFALLSVWGAGFFIDRTVWGYALRVRGGNPDAAAYAGIDAGRATVLALCLSGGFAGMAGVNEIFVGVAVGLMAGSKAWALIPGALLFAVLSQGSVDLTIDNPKINRELVVLVQGLVILFAGALRGQIRLPRFGRVS
jgi:simple sugar transport system permease protein